VDIFGDQGEEGLETLLNPKPYYSPKISSNSTMSSTMSVFLRAGLLIVFASLGSCQYHQYQGHHQPPAPTGPQASAFTGPSMNPLINMQSNCNYLKNSKSNVPYNAGAFKIYTRSRAAKVTKGTPIEVTIGPFSRHLSMFNFTSFILYAKPILNMNMEYEFTTPMSTNKHLGVFQLFSQWSAGAGGLSCGPNSNTDDSVAAFEDLIMPYGMPRPARNQVSVLWWPTSDTLVLPRGSAMKFVANIQSGGKWFKLQSTPWKIDRPVDQWTNMFPGFPGGFGGFGGLQTGFPGGFLM